MRKMTDMLVLEQLYPEMEEATIGRWLVAADATVEAGQPVAELITDKVAYEYHTPAGGMILAVLTPEKSVVPVGTTLAVVGAAGAQVDNLEELLEQNRRLAEAREEKLRNLQEATAAEPVQEASRQAGGVRATPAARRLARERGIDLASLTGSGPGGMITVEDIQ
jgi:pyruvate/2-oxoglutarate dehydrogenase complex dihydrolipoamide acyltransferase (E2) component